MLHNFQNEWDNFLLKEEIDIKIYTFRVLLSFGSAGRGAEIGKIENILRSIPNVTVVDSKESKLRHGFLYSEMVMKVNSIFFDFADQNPLLYFRDKLKPRIEKVLKGLPPSFKVDFKGIKNYRLV